MNEKSFLVLLGESATDRYRLSCRVDKGRVTVFLVQYEAFIDGVWHAVVRYDTAHGFPHRDLLHPSAAGEKTEFPNRSNAEVLTLGQEDIKRNWQSYRERFVLEMKSE
jgi:hypothetical protein